jgi:hypothetical protein
MPPILKQHGGSLGIAGYLGMPDNLRAALDTDITFGHFCTNAL